MIHYKIDPFRIYCCQMPSVPGKSSGATANLTSIKCLLFNEFCNVCNGLAFCGFSDPMFPNPLQPEQDKPAELKTDILSIVLQHVSSLVNHLVVNILLYIEIQLGT